MYILSTYILLKNTHTRAEQNMYYLLLLNKIPYRHLLVMNSILLLNRIYI
jgi:hypothetical protein